jgi:hypothetical protein
VAHDGAVRADSPSVRRPLTTTERALLDALLDHDFDGAAELRAQVRRATASTGCECGCVTIDLHVPDDVPVSSASGTAPVEGTVVDAGGAPIGGVWLFVEHGRLAGLEVHSLDEAPSAVPPPERVSWDTDPGDRTSWWRRRLRRPTAPAGRP